MESPQTKKRLKVHLLGRHLRHTNYRFHLRRFQIEDSGINSLITKCTRNLFVFFVIIIKLN